MDRISNLPDEIVCHILSFLPIKKAGLTSVFSKRWRNLFAMRPDLHLRCVDVDFVFWNSERIKSFINFVDRVFAVSGNSTMRKFSVEFVRSVESVHINRWVIKAMSRGVLDLHLNILMETLSVDEFTQYTLPLEFFTCKTIVKLRLGRLISIAMVPENASLPSLKTLILDDIQFSGCGFETLVSACPVLKELTITGHPWDSKQCRSISSPSLERLTLWSCKGCSEYSLSFDTPSLVYLEYRDYVGEYYPIVNLNSLVEAKLFLADRSPNEGNPMNLIKWLRNVKILRLSSLETSKVLYSFAESIPPLKNLSRLSIATYLPRSCSSWKLLPVLLKKIPNLETLVIQGPLHFYDVYHTQSETLICKSLSEYSFLSSCPVKVLEITDYCGTEVELEQMKHFLEKLPCLELVIVRPRPNATLTFSTDLKMLPRASQIELQFFPTKN